MCEKLTHGSNCHANKSHIPPRNMCVYCFALNSDLSVDIWEPNPDPAFARHPTMFGLLALGWVDWIDAGRVEDGTHNATGDLKCLRLMGMLSPRKNTSTTPHTKVLEERTWGQLSQPLCNIYKDLNDEATLKNGNNYTDPFQFGGSVHIANWFLVPIGFECIASKNKDGYKLFMANIFFVLHSECQKNTHKIV